MRWLLFALALIAARPALATVAVPADYVTNPFYCARQGNDAPAMQAAINAAKPKTAIHLIGPCSLSKSVAATGKSELAIVGDGPDATIISSLNEQSGALRVFQSNHVIIGGLQVYYPKTTIRAGVPERACFAVQQSNNVTLDGVTARACAGAGVLIVSSKGVAVRNSLVDRSRADAFHATSGSQDVTYQSDVATSPGDDCFASIGNGNYPNRNISTFDSICTDGKASGVSFEGTVGGKAYRNRLYRTRAACIRLASQKNWNSIQVDQIDIQDNYLEGCVTQTTIGHGSIMIFTNYKPIGPSVSIVRTTIVRPASGPAVRAYGASGISVQASIGDTRSIGVPRCWAIGANTSLARYGNLLGANAC